ncbi:sulfatase family protein [Novipirellula sp. SH528]|uniref:sulfatase family protein n=1 Tax=Novipirellula sp. SH528 TaxID=3454466 RepID=UPI003FA0DF92
MKFLALLLLLVVGFTNLAQADDRPNFVFILADDCSYRDLELYGGPAKTPNLIQLASEGMKFNRCYQAAPMCSPTRHALYTGLYPVKSGAYPNHAEAYHDVKSIPHYLSEVGYRVALAGKQHIAPADVFPFEYIKEFAEPTNRDVETIDGTRYPKVLQLLRDSAKEEKPFCLFLCSNEPHGPYTKGDPTPYLNAKLSPQQFEHQRKSYAKYLAEITYFDGQAGEIMGMLEQLDLRKNTIVMVATEQGSSFPFGKWTCYEIGVASGLVASWKGHIEAGSESQAIVEYTDIVPTFLDAAGATIPDSLDGTSFLPVLLGKETSHSELAFSLQTTRGVTGCQAPYGVRSVVDKHHRYIRNLFPENEFSIPTSRSLQEATRDLDDQTQQRANRFLKRPEEELYDIQSDPYCLNNLALNPDFSETKARLSAAVDDWMTEQGDLGRQTELDAYSRQSEGRRRQRIQQLKDAKGVQSDKKARLSR